MMDRYDLFNRQPDRTKRYWLFAGDLYYPCGGMDDLINTYDDVEIALAHGNWFDWSMVLDMETREWRG